MMKNNFYAMLEGDIAGYYIQYQNALDRLRETKNIYVEVEACMIRGIAEGYKKALERILAPDKVKELFEKYDFAYERIIEAGESGRCGKQAKV